MNKHAFVPDRDACQEFIRAALEIRDTLPSNRMAAIVDFEQIDSRYGESLIDNKLKDVVTDAIYEMSYYRPRKQVEENDLYIGDSELEVLIEKLLQDLKTIDGLLS